MKIDIITIFPEMFEKVFEFGIPAQAIKSGLLCIKIHNLRDYAEGNYRQVDDKQFGGGIGMVLMPEPLGKAIDALKGENSVVINLSPRGRKLNQENAERLSKIDHLIIICGRYEGIDQRIIDIYVDDEISIGDYVLSGAEIPAMVLVDSVARLIPGAIKNEGFNDSESFSDPNNRSILDFPVYTRPQEYKGKRVPEILLSGNHKEIEKWRELQKIDYE